MTDDQTTNAEQADQAAKAALLSRARAQLAAASAEFQQSLSKIKDPGTRRELTTSYVHLLRNSLGKAQTTLTRYRGKAQPRHNTEQTASLSELNPPAGQPEITDQQENQ